MPYLNEAQRRVLGNLSEPHSVTSLARLLVADDHSPWSREEPFEDVLSQVEAIVSEQVADGRIVELGRVSDPAVLITTVGSSEDAIDLPPVKAKALASRLQSGRDLRLDSGELLILSTKGLEALEA